MQGRAKWKGGKEPVGEGSQSFRSSVAGAIRNGGPLRPSRRCKERSGLGAKMFKRAEEGVR